jgi:DNA helicase-2/ATP-dependent DNA helicase PcrA
LESQAEFVATKMVELIDSDGLNFGDFAILYRSNKGKRVSSAFQKAMIMSRFPYVVFGAKKLLERKDCQDVLALIKALVNPKDQLSFRRVLHNSKGVGPRTVDMIIEMAARRNIHFSDALHDPEFMTSLNLKPRALDSLIALSEKITSWRNQISSVTIEPVEFLKAIITEAAIDVSADIVDLFVKALTISPEDDELSSITPPVEQTLGEKFSVFLQRLSLDHMAWEVDKDKFAPKVTVSTIHQAKVRQLKNLIKCLQDDQFLYQFGSAKPIKKLIILSTFCLYKL